ncbi:MAG: carboxypeptidase-like regulatory domain-containing protein [Dysgonamonadaceae bacterium]|jgi:hypothetical protein|nr:carboxypeptidase-like regulatory domain-containing protein [Dysgonamonadaceae bacterium]
MIKIFTLLLLINTYIISNAQNIKITGKVLDENSDIVIAATVSLISKDSVLIRGAITNSSGDFELTTSKKQALCFLRITHIEFENSYHTIVPDKDTTITVQLKEKTVLLGEVQIVAKKQIYEFQNEKLVVNINNIPNIQTYDLSRLLQTLPGVINTEGLLTLNGKTAVIYLDGKKQMVNLSLLPASAIEKIELINSSGGIYDATDEAIINIIYKKQKVDGYYLSFGGNSAVYDKINADGGGSATLMFKKKNVMLNSTLTYRNTYTSSIANDTLLYSNNTLLYQYRNSEGWINVFMGLANLSWDIKKGHNLDFRVNFYEDFSKKTSKQQYVFQPEDKQNKWDIKSKDNNDMWSGQIEYSSPDSLKSKFKASYNIVYGGIRGRQHILEESIEVLYTDDEVLAYRQGLKSELLTWHRLDCRDFEAEGQRSSGIKGISLIDVINDFSYSIVTSRISQRV